MKKLPIFISLFCIAHIFWAQERTLDYFLSSAEQNNDSLFNTLNLQKIGQLQQEVIIAQNRLP